MRYTLSDLQELGRIVFRSGGYTVVLSGGESDTCLLFKVSVYEGMTVYERLNPITIPNARAMEVQALRRRIEAILVNVGLIDDIPF